MLFAGTSSLTITFDCSMIYEALMKACRPQLEEAYRNARDESTASIIERMLSAIDNNNYNAYEFYEWCLKNQNPAALMRISGFEINICQHLLTRKSYLKTASK